jgi:hypothetical protein
MAKRASAADRAEALEVVRGLMQVSGKWGWETLCEAVDKLYQMTPKRERAALVATLRVEIEQEQARWGDAGEAPASWLSRAALGEDVPLGLTWSWGFGGQTWAALSLMPMLVEHEAVSALRELTLFGGGEPLPASVWAMVCGSARLGELEMLSLSGVPISDAQVGELLAAKGAIWRSLRQLHLYDSRCTVESARLFAGAAVASGLEALEFGIGNKIGWDGRMALASSPHLSAAVRKAQNVGAVRTAQASPDEETRFGDVRSALQGAPGEAAWCQLTHALSGVGAEQLEREIGVYVEAGLKSWPDGARVAPEAWVDELLAGTEHPALALSRAVHVRGEHLNGTRYLNAKMAGRLYGSRMWQGVRALELDQVELAGSTLRALLGVEGHPGFTSLRALCGGEHALGEVAARLKGVAWASGVRELALGHVGASFGAMREVAELLKEPRWSGLEALSLRHVELPHAALEGSPWLGGLRRLELRVRAQELAGVLEVVGGAQGPPLEAFALEAVPATACDAVLGAQLGRALARSAATLEVLELGGLEMTPEGLAALCATSGLERLRRLVLWMDGREPRAGRLLEGAALPALRELSITLSGSSQPAPLAAWSQAACWAGLRSLEVRGWTLEDGLVEGVEAPLPPELGLAGPSYGMRQLRALGRRPELESLRVESPDDPFYTPSFEPGGWPALRSLELCYGERGSPSGAWASELVEAAPSLSALRLRGSLGGDPMVDALLASGALPRLTALELERCKIKKAGALRLIGQLERMTRLGELSLAHNSLGAAVADALATQPALAHLHRLDLRGNRMGFEGRQALVSSPHLPVMLWTRLF